MNMGSTLAAAEVLTIGPLARAAAELDAATRERICKVVEAACAKYLSPGGV